jgi:adenylate cyclase
MSGVDQLQILQSLDCAGALANVQDGRIVYENARFFDWFPPSEDPDAVLAARVSALDAETMAKRLDAGRAYELETEVKAGERSVPLRVSVRRVAGDSDGHLLVQAIDASREKCAQFMLDSYSRMAEKNAKELEKEKVRVERLLRDIMPRSVYEELKDYGVATPQRFDHTTIVMLDFVRFTEMVSELNDIFSAFDRIVEMFGCERLRTIGDSYMAACGLPEENPDHAANVAKVALRMRRYLERRNATHTQQWRCRIGVNTGPVIGSLVGIQKYVYDLFGPGVNLAARMESHSEPMKITVSENTWALTKDEFLFTERGEFEIKGFGTMPLYFLEGEV